MKDDLPRPDASHGLLVFGALFATAALIAFSLRAAWSLDALAAAPALAWLATAWLAAGRKDPAERAAVLAGALLLAPLVAVASVEAVREAAAAWGPWPKRFAVAASLAPAVALALAARLALGLVSEPQRWRVGVVGAIVCAVAAAGALARGGGFDAGWLAASAGIVLLAAALLAPLRSRRARPRLAWLAALALVAVPVDLVAGALLAEHATEAELTVELTEVSGPYTVFLPWFEPRASHADVVALLAERVRSTGGRADVLEAGPSLRVRADGPVEVAARVRFEGSAAHVQAARDLALADVALRVTEGAPAGVRVSLLYRVHEGSDACFTEARLDARPAPGTEARWPAGTSLLAQGSRACA